MLFITSDSGANFKLVQFKYLCWAPGAQLMWC